MFHPKMKNVSHYQNLLHHILLTILEINDDEDQRPSLWLVLHLRQTIDLNLHWTVSLNVLHVFEVLPMQHPVQARHCANVHLRLILLHRVHVLKQHQVYSDVPIVLQIHHHEHPLECDPMSRRLRIAKWQLNPQRHLIPQMVQRHVIKILLLPTYSYF